MRPKPRTTAPIQLVAFFAITLIFAPGLSAAGKYKVLYSFKDGTDGNFPSGALVFDTSGNLYGTTVNGAPQRELDGARVHYEAHQENLTFASSTRN